MRLKMKEKCTGFCLYKFSDFFFKWNLDLSFPLKYYLDNANEGKIKTEIQAPTYGYVDNHLWIVVNIVKQMNKFGN